MTAGADQAAAVATITAVSTLIGVAITSVFSVLVPLLKEAVGGAKERERERRRQIAEALLELQALVPEVVVARMVNVPGKHALTKKLHEEMGKTWDPVALSGFAQTLPLGRLELLVKESEHVIVDIGLNATEALRQSVIWVDGQPQVAPEGGNIWGAFIEVSSAWYRGTLDAEDVRRTYDEKVARQLDRLLGKAAKSDGPPAPAQPTG